VRGGTLNLNGTTQTIGTLTVGGGASGSNATVAIGAGTLNLGGTVTYSASNDPNAATISGTGGGQLSLNGTRTFTVGDSSATATELAISAVVQDGTGSSGITKTGGGTLSFSGGVANTYTGLTTVSNGQFDLNKTSGVTSIAGDGNTATTDVSVAGGTLRWRSSNQVADTATIVMSSGLTDLNGKIETLGTFANSGGAFTTGVGGHLIGTTATMDWSGGTNTINADALVEDGHIKISGGTNTVQGLAGTPVGTTAGGILRLNTGGAGLEMTGGALILNSDGTSAGKLDLRGDVSSHASATTSTISSGGAAAIAGTVDLNAAPRTFTVENGAAADDMSISATLTNGSIIKEGAGTLVLTGTNTHTDTTINAGTIMAGVGSLVSVFGGVTVNSGGTLLLSGAGRHIGNAVGVSLNGGTFNTGGFSEPGGAPSGSNNIGALTLTSTSTLDFGSSNTSVLEFGGLGPHTGGAVLQIIDWDGVPGIGGSGDRLLFTGLATTFISNYQQGEVSFDGQSGYTTVQFFDGDSLAYFEVVGLVAVPETATWATGSLAAAGLLLMQRRRVVVSGALLLSAVKNGTIRSQTSRVDRGLASGLL
jgi:autotransporter-associated beta strand protein